MPDVAPLDEASASGRLLAERALLSAPALERARRLEAESGERVDRIALKLGLVSERDLALAYADALGTALVGAAEFPAKPIAADRIGRTFLSQARVVPLLDTATGLVVAMADPFDDGTASALEFAL